MAFVVLVGCPQAGKSIFSTKLSEFLAEKKKRSFVVSDDDLFHGRKSQVYKNWQVEKSTRLKIKGEVEKHMSKDTILIIDSINYFKGHRYELNVLSRNIDIEYCTVYFDIPKNVCVERNEESKEWDSEILESIFKRMEVPDEKNRMNKFELPIFRVSSNDDETYSDIFMQIFNLFFGEIKRSLRFRRKVNELKEKSKMAKKNNPEYVAKIEQIASKILKNILSKKSSGYPGEKIVVHENTKERFIVKRNLTAGKLMKQKKQFMKSVEAEDIQKDLSSIPDMFISFLNTKLM